MNKKLSLLLCVVSCLFLITGCSLTKVNENWDKDVLSENTEAFVEEWFAYDFQSVIDTYEDQMTEDELESYQSYVDMQETCGDMTEITKTQYSQSADAATIVETVETESGDSLDFTVSYDEEGSISDWKVEEHQTVGQIMGKALLNTVMCILIVFAALIFISLIISCFKIIGKIGQPKAEQAQTEVVAVAPVAAVEENLTDDLELVAVIAAAIAAAEGRESADGLVVRSIIRR